MDRSIASKRRGQDVRVALFGKRGVIVEDVERGTVQ
jgi:hypothetical protein